MASTLAGSAPCASSSSTSSANFPPLFPHQRRALTRAYNHLTPGRGFYLAHGVGTGKSRTAIEIAKASRASRILILCGPVAALGVWRNELLKWWPTAHRPGEGNAQTLGAPTVEVINIDKLVRNPKLVSSLVTWKPDLLIFDEAHYVKTPTAQRTRITQRLCNVAGEVLFLSGTPAHDPLDYWAQYRMLDPQHPLWRQPFTKYKQQVALLGGPMRNWVVGFKPGVQRTIADAIAPCTDVFDTKDLHLPEPIYTTVPVELYTEEGRAYNQMLKTFRAEIKGEEILASTILVKMMRLHQIASGHGYTNSGEVWSDKSAKWDALVELLDQRVGQKVVVVCRFSAELRRLVRERGHVGYIDGSCGEQHRTETLLWFRDTTAPATLVIQPRAGGIAADMTAADALIFYSFEPSSIVYRQTVGRVWRTGQTGHVQILSLVGQQTVDEQLLDGLRRHLNEYDLVKYLREGMSL